MVFRAEMNLLVERSQCVMMHGVMPGRYAEFQRRFLAGARFPIGDAANGPWQRNGVERPRDAVGPRWMDTSVICC